MQRSASIKRLFKSLAFTCIDMGRTKLTIIGIAAVLAACAPAAPKKSLYERMGGIHKLAAAIDMCVDMEAKDPMLLKNERFKMATAVGKPYMKFAITNTLAAGTGGPQKCIYNVAPFAKWIGLTKAQSDHAWTLRKMAFNKAGISNADFMEMKSWYIKSESMVKPMAPTKETFKDASSLYARLGGIMAITAVSDDFVNRIPTGKAIMMNKRTVKAVKSGRFTDAGLKYLLSELIASASGGPFKYSGRSMKQSHKDLMISEKEWEEAGVMFKTTLDKFKVGEQEQKELFAAIAATHGDIVTKKH